MNKTVQIVITAVVSVVVFYLADMFLRISGLLEEHLWAPRTLAVIFALLIGVALWEKFDSDSHSLFTRVFQGAFFVGGVAFLAGFIGPILFTPDANQGPLLGVFVTGPIGTIFGAIGGFIFWFFRDRENAESDD